MIPMNPSADPTLGARRFGPIQTAGLMIGLLLLQTGCAANTPTQAMAEKTDPYYQDAQLCRSQNPAKMLPAGVDPAARVDEAGYLQCLNKRGYQQEAKTDPLLVAIKKCQQQGGSKTVSASGATTIKPPKPEEVRQCLKLRGFPSTQFPPPPVAAMDSSTASGATAPKATLKNVPKAAPVKDDRERVQTIYIPRKTKAPQ